MIINYRVEYDTDTKNEKWYYQNQLHREDDYPAVIIRTTSDSLNIREEWWVQGKLHRGNGRAAICYKNGTYEWWVDGQRHREDGPAIEFPGGKVEWWLNGEQYNSKEDFTAELEKRKSVETCNGKIVEIEGKQYKLVEITNS